MRIGIRGIKGIFALAIFVLMLVFFFVFVLGSMVALLPLFIVLAVLGVIVALGGYFYRVIRKVKKEEPKDVLDAEFSVKKE